ncbi:uncharacterized protein LOC101892249 isoform X1 [Musca domestica]|uniref:Uncharacterized protein LOC101892249 isoform X1 n=1 Tax=Musca domestica TaxID=7370 RepID=A0A9J7IE93_MUSDO|nr:uncharacterized protein LOC101892249 isoform X1 [Musca domestica]
MESESLLENNGFDLTKDSMDSSSDTNNKVKFNENNNQQHIVPIGLLIVLLTIYLGLSGVQSCFANSSQNEDILKSLPNLMYNQVEINERQLILERFLEYKDICRDLEIFTKEINRTKPKVPNKSAEIRKKETTLKTEYRDYSGSGSGSRAVADGSGDECATTKSYSKKYKKPKSKYYIKLPNNPKNGFHKHNKSTKAKNARHHDKKDLNINKKNSSAEPIIYLFALVFIYLLLKAASDINQHYKSENKNDKRFMRRCSLQSYAQAHRDRRSSKELALKTKQQQQHQRTLASLQRSIIAEQQKPKPQQQQHFYHHHHHHIETSSVQRTPSTPPTLSPAPRSSHGNWQLLRQHMTLSVDNSDLIVTPLTKPEFSSMMKRRRCSVPVALNYHRQTTKNSSNPNPLGTLTDPLIRRTSITMPLDSLDPLAASDGTKRRVRMINRH